MADRRGNARRATIVTEKSKLEKLKQLESPETPKWEMRRYIREQRFSLESQKLIERTGGINSPRMINLKLTDFLSKAYLGNLYGNHYYGENRVGEQINEYLYFLNDEDRFYRITLSHILMNLMYIYIKVNEIKYYTKDKNTREFVLYDGVNEPDELKDYFPEAYEEGARDQNVEFDDVKTTPKILGSITMGNSLNNRRNMDDVDFEDVVKRSIVLLDALKYSRKELNKTPTTKAARISDELDELDE